jgi:hypothetical protein
VREARALGVPVVAVRAGDIARWAAADEGIAVVRDDAHAIAGSLRAAIAANESGPRAEAAVVHSP